MPSVHCRVPNHWSGLENWPRTNRRRPKASGGEVVEHVPRSGFKHDKTLSFEAQQLHTAQKRKSGLLTGKTAAVSAWEGRGEAQEQWRVWGNAGPGRAPGRGTHPSDHRRAPDLSPHDLGGKEDASGPQLAEEPGPTRAHKAVSFTVLRERAGRSSLELPHLEHRRSQAIPTWAPRAQLPARPGCEPPSPPKDHPALTSSSWLWTC